LSGKSSSSTPAYPSQNSSIQLNPSAVPTDPSWGIEALYFDSSVDAALVKGFGRVGAGISASNGEETFFGPPGLEVNSTRELRMKEGHKLKSEKLTLATAVELLSNRGRGLRKFQLNLGVSGRYNGQTKALWPGGGLSGIAGPLTFGYSMTQDDYLMDNEPPGTAAKEQYRYTSELLSGGLYLSSIALDYSMLRMHGKVEALDSTVTLITATLFLNRWIVTASNRREDSERQDYDYKNKVLKPQKIKEEIFGGIQFAPTKMLLVGAFYNYYLLREFSAGLTLFF
jgi:hypothetical protein